MLCPSCQTEFPVGAAFCPKCGQRVDGGASPPAPPAPPAQQFAGARGAAASEPERELWSGGYSPKAMLGWWIMEGILIVAAVVVIIALPPNPITWIIAGGIVVAFGLWLLLDLLVKRLSVHYKLTSEQLSHQAGLLTRVSNRVELIDVDDVTLKQTLIERMVGVGSILITSSDKSHPHLVLQGIDNVEQVTRLVDTAAREQRRKRAAYIESV